VSLEIISFLGVVILLIAATLDRENLPRSIFCLLMLAVMVVWSYISDYSNNWMALNSDTAPLYQVKIVFTAFYLIGCALNFLLLLYLFTYNPDYKLIVYPIAFYAVLNIFVAIEYYAFSSFETEYMLTIYNSSPEEINSLEVFLLAADRHDYRRNGKRFIASIYSRVHTLAPTSILKRVN